MMKRVTYYKVVYSDVPTVLADKVQELLADGWQPFGPPFIGSSDSCVHQAMVLYEDDVVNLHGFPRQAGDVSAFDFVVDLRRPDGSIVTVLIPDVQPDHYTRTGQADAQQEPYGLNLVCRGHYT